MSVTPKEIVEALRDAEECPTYAAHLADRIEREGIEPPPEGYAIVPIAKLNEVHHWMLNAERVFKRDISNHKFVGFDLMARTIDSISDMLTAAKESL